MFTYLLTCLHTSIHSLHPQMHPVQFSKATIWLLWKNPLSNRGENETRQFKRIVSYSDFNSTRSKRLQQHFGKIVSQHFLPYCATRWVITMISPYIWSGVIHSRTDVYCSTVHINQQYLHLHTNISPSLDELCTWPSNTLSKNNYTNIYYTYQVKHIWPTQIMHTTQITNSPNEKTSCVHLPSKCWPKH